MTAGINPLACDAHTLAIALARDAQTPLESGVTGFTGLGAQSPDSLVGAAAFDVLTGPFAALRGRALDTNIRLMAAYCGERGLELAPHVKTTMSPQVFSRQLRAGAWGLTAAHIGQVEVYRNYGVRRILLANQLVDPAAIDYLARALASDPSFRPYVWVDSVAQIHLMDAALSEAAPGRPVDVLVELGVLGGRTGVRSAADGLAVARYAGGRPMLRVSGVTGFEGSAATDADAASLAAVRDYCRELRRFAQTVVTEFGDGRSAEDPMVVSAGGSSYFDIVAEELGGLGSPAVQVVLRSGSYVTHDDGHIDDLSPARRGTGPEFVAALRVWAPVLSCPEPGLALVCAGKRDLAYDLDLPVVTAVRSAATGEMRGGDGLAVTGLNDQHAFVAVADGADLAVGDWVEMGISHPCTAFDKWRAIAVLGDDDRIESVAFTHF